MTGRSSSLCAETSRISRPCEIVGEHDSFQTCMSTRVPLIIDARVLEYAQVLFALSSFLYAPQLTGNSHKLQGNYTPSIHLCCYGYDHYNAYQ